VADREQSVLSFVRADGSGKPDAHALVVLNLTPVPRPGYRLGAPMAGTYQLALNSDEARFGGSAYPVDSRVTTDSEPWHGYLQSLVVTLPPLGMLVLLPEPGTTPAVDSEPEPTLVKARKTKTSKPGTNKRRTTKTKVARPKAEKPGTTRPGTPRDTGKRGEKA